MTFEKDPDFSVRVHDGDIRTGTDKTSLDAFLEQLLDDLAARYGLAACFEAKTLLDRHPKADRGQLASLLGQVLRDDPVDGTECSMRILIADLRIRLSETKPREPFEPLFGAKAGGGVDDLPTLRLRTELLRQLCHLAKGCETYRATALQILERQRGSKSE